MTKGAELFFKTKLIMAELELSRATETYKEIAKVIESYMGKKTAEEIPAHIGNLLTDAIKWHKEILRLRVLVKECRSSFVYGFDEALKKVQ